MALFFVPLLGPPSRLYMGKRSFHNLVRETRFPGFPRKDRVSQEECPISTRRQGFWFTVTPGVNS